MDVKHINQFLDSVTSIMPQLGLSDVKKKGITLKRRFIESPGVMVIVGIMGKDTTKLLLNHHNLQWTIAEDKLLGNLIKMGRSFDEISIILNRTSPSIKSRFYAIRNDNFNSESLKWNSL